MGPWRPGVKTETAAAVNQGPDVSQSLKQNHNTFDIKREQRKTYNGSTTEILGLLSGQIKGNTQSGSIIMTPETPTLRSCTSMEPVLRLRIMGDLRWMLIGSETGSAWSGWSWERSSRLP